MANSLSAKKRIRQNEVHRARNQARRNALRSRLRICRDAFTHGELDKAKTAFVDACSALDREANRGLIHRNLAARSKSHLARKLHALEHKAD